MITILIFLSQSLLGFPSRFRFFSVNPFLFRFQKLSAFLLFQSPKIFFTVIISSSLLLILCLAFNLIFLFIFLFLWAFIYDLTLHVLLLTISFAFPSSTPLTTQLIFMIFWALDHPFQTVPFSPINVQVHLYLRPI